MGAVAEEVVCHHCGTPFVVRGEEREFCCTGCRYVFELIQAQKLGRYYDLRSEAVQPVGNRVFHPGQWQWLEEMAHRAEATGTAELIVRVQGLSCAACVWLVEEIFKRQPGSLRAVVNVTTGRIRFSWEAKKFNAMAFAEDLNRFGYGLGPDDGVAREDGSGLVRRIGLCGAFAMNAMLFSLPHYLGLETDNWLSRVLDLVALACATLSMLVGGSYFIRRAWLSLRSGLLHIDFPIGLGLIVGYSATVYAWATGHRELAYFDFVSIFTLLMLTGRWLQERVVAANRNRLLGASRVPTQVELVPGGGAAAMRIPLGDIRSQMRLRLEPGGVVPVRSRLTGESAVFGLEWISGESESREFSSGSIVPSGSFNLSRNAVEVEAVEGWDESLLRALTQEPAAAAGGAMMDRIIRIYLGVVVVIALAGCVGWWLAGNPARALQVLVSTLVISCPCAIGVSLPLAEEIATALARKRGCFVRNGSLWSRLRRVRAVAFDKTGTLTLDVPVLRDVAILATLTDEERGVLAAMVSASLHPVGKSLRESLLISNLRQVAPATYTLEEVTGAGVCLRAGANEWRLGRPEWTGSEATTAECTFSRNGKILATFGFVETLRPEAREQIAGLQERGYAIWLLSGDRRRKVETLARDLGLPPEQVLAEATPQEKADTVRNLAVGTLMIGDGANDSLAFQQALCCGTPAIDRGLLENRADFYFTGAGLQGLLGLLDLATQQGRAVRRALIFTIIYNLVAVGLALSGWIVPVVAAVMMPASSVVSLALVAMSYRK